MLFTSRSAACAAALGVLAAAGQSVFAAPIYWDNPSGSNGTVSWSDGQSDKDYFGDATVNGSEFFFTPSGFVSTATPSRPYDTTSDRLSFIITAAPGQFLSAINLEETGAFTLIGTGTTKARGTLAVYSLNTPTFAAPFTDTIDTVYYDTDNNTVINSPDKPSTEGSGNWVGTASIALPTGISSVQVVLTNYLQSSATPGAVQIDKNSVHISAVVPEPSMLGLAGLGGLALLRRRRMA